LAQRSFEKKTEDLNKKKPRKNRENNLKTCDYHLIAAKDFVDQWDREWPIGGKKFVGKRNFGDIPKNGIITAISDAGVAQSEYF
jgi:hypothetical protein